jgi:hypothetical protein
MLAYGINDEYVILNTNKEGYIINWNIKGYSNIDFETPDLKEAHRMFNTYKDILKFKHGFLNN